MDEEACRAVGPICMSAAIMGPLAGDEQSAPRAELTAAIMAMRATGRAVRLRIISVFEYVCHGGNRLVEGGGLPKTNRDLWMELQQAMQKRSAPLEFHSGQGAPG